MSRMLGALVALVALDLDEQPSGPPPVEGCALANGVDHSHGIVPVHERDHGHGRDHDHGDPPMSINGDRVLHGATRADNRKIVSG